MARIEQLRDRDGQRAWSFESIGRRVGRTGASVGAIVRGQTRQPDLQVVVALAALLDIPHTRIIAGNVPALSAAVSAMRAEDDRGWPSEPLLDAIERVTHSASRAVLDRLICTYTAEFAMIGPPGPLTIGDWKLDAHKLDAAITASGLPNTVVARAVGISEKAVRKLRAGHVRRPALAIIDGLATVLDVPATALTAGDVPQLGPARRSAGRCLWLSDEAWRGLTGVTNPDFRAAVERTIRLVAETLALNQT